MKTLIVAIGLVLTLVLMTTMAQAAPPPKTCTACPEGATQVTDDPTCGGAGTINPGGICCQVVTDESCSRLIGPATKPEKQRCQDCFTETTTYTVYNNQCNATDKIATSEVQCDDFSSSYPASSEAPRCNNTVTESCGR